MKKNNLFSSKWFRYGLVSAAAVLIIILFCGIGFYRTYLLPNIQSDKTVILNIHKGDNFDKVFSNLQQQNVLVRPQSFEKAARKSGYADAVRSGHYELKSGMNNRQMLVILKQGLQKPVRIQFNNLRTLEQLAGVLSRQIMLDSLTLLDTFKDSQWQDSLGFRAETAMSLFLPDTYEVWWNCSPEKLMQTFQRAYRQFWTEERLKKAADKGLEPWQVSTLASIIEEETNRKDEWPVVAGLYMNRMKKRMYLQACPTIKFAMNDWSMHRVLKEYTEVDSPYNTYKHMGLPPGPIRIPSKTALDAVLNASQHNYLYMCAKDDFSGGHYYSSTLAQHNRYAERYHRALDRNRIMK